jgi:hypothetical protein
LDRSEALVSFVALTRADGAVRDATASRDGWSLRDREDAARLFAHFLQDRLDYKIVYGESEGGQLRVQASGHRGVALISVTRRGSAEAPLYVIEHATTARCVETRSLAGYVDGVAAAPVVAPKLAFPWRSVVAMIAGAWLLSDIVELAFEPANLLVYIAHLLR